MLRPLLLTLSLLAPTGIVAQTYVSPQRFATAKGGHSFPIFMWKNATYQQIHADVPKMTIRQIAFRPGVALGSRTVDLEFRIGNSIHASRGTTFARNFVGAPTVAMKRRALVLPNSNAPFSWKLPFDQPWVYTKAIDLAWEAKMFASTGKNYIFNADGFTFTTRARSRGTRLGTSCKPTPNGRHFTDLFSDFSTDRQNGRMDLLWSMSLPPTNANLLFLSPTGANVAIPGLCTNVRVGPVVATLPIFFTRRVLIPYQPGLVGVPVYAQVAATDPNRPAPLKISVTNGERNALPPALPNVTAVSRLFNQFSNTARTGTLNNFAGLVTEFR